MWLQKLIEHVICQWLVKREYSTPMLIRSIKMNVLFLTSVWLNLCSVFQPKSERVPLRDVQNELLNLQDSPTLMLKHVSKHERDSKMKVWSHSFAAFSSLALSFNLLWCLVYRNKNKEFYDILFSSSMKLSLMKIQA